MYKMYGKFIHLYMFFSLLLSAKMEPVGKKVDLKKRKKHGQKKEEKMKLDFFSGFFRRFEVTCVKRQRPTTNS